MQAMKQGPGVDAVLPTQRQGGVREAIRCVERKVRVLAPRVSSKTGGLALVVMVQGR